MNSNFIETLIKYLPQPHTIEELDNLKKKGVELCYIEKFVATLGAFDRLVPRLSCIKFQLDLKDLVEELKSDIAAATAACDEMMSSQKFIKILQLILSIGNVLNKSEAVGFQLAILPKLNEIKSSNHKQTLLHFIVEKIQQHFPELLNFADELSHIDKAARLKYSNIEESVQSIGMLSESLQKELEYAKTSKSKLPGDKFIEMMTPFSLECRDQVKALKNMMSKMEKSYNEVGKYFAFDVGKCLMEECFSNVYKFKAHFAKAYEELGKINETKNVASEAQSSQPVDTQQQESAPVNKSSSSSSTSSSGFRIREFEIKLTRLTIDGS